MAERDDSLDKLTSFCDTVQKANAALARDTEALEEGVEALQQLDEAKASALNDALEALLDGLASAQEKALEAVEGVTQKARTIAADDLPEAGSEVDAAESAFELQLQQDKGSLIQHFQALVGGFDAVEVAAKGLEAKYDQMDDAVEAAIKTLEGDIDTQDKELETSETATIAALEGATEALTEEHKAGLDTDAKAAADEWLGLPQKLEEACQGPIDQLTALYQDWGGDAGSAADALETDLDWLPSAATALSEGRDHLETAAGDVEGNHKVLAEEEETVKASVGDGAETADALLPLLGELVTAVQKAEQIKQALDVLD